MADPRVPAREACVVRYLLEKHAAERPGKVFVRFEDGTVWTYGETLDHTRRAAAGLASLGVRQGDHVLCWLPNGRHALLTWFAASYLGAVNVPLNPAYRGKQLEHVLTLCDAKAGVVDAGFAPRLLDIELAHLRHVILVDGPSPEGLADRVQVHLMADHLETKADPDVLDRPIEPWDNAYILFTSGTTGPSKAVMCSYVQAWTNTYEAYHYLGPDDMFLVNLPLNHVSGKGAIYAMLAHGGSIALYESFKTDTFWDTIRETQASVCILMGVMLPFLLKVPPGAGDTSHPLRIGMIVPWGEDALAFAERFGVDLYTVFNMTELSSPIVSEANPPKLGVAGRVRAGFEVRIVDDHDCEVPIGEVGELIIRADRPWALCSGYYNNPEATAKAWRNGWFHTGDAFRKDEDGYYYFVDRLKDAIRRRGENISSFEVEAEVLTHPAVREAAAIPVPNELSEDEVMVCVSLTPGATLKPEALLEYLVPRMAHFMVPRFIRILDELPKTSTQKIQKTVLRDQGVTDDTWDREAAGIRVTRNGIVRDDQKT